MSKKEKLKLKVESQRNWHQISFDELKTYLINHKKSLRPYVVAKHGNFVKAAYVKEAVRLVYELENDNKWR